MTFQFTTFNEFLAMGGHGAFVWACYGITLLAVVLAVVFVKNERKKFLKQLALQQARQQNKAHANNQST